MAAVLADILTRDDALALRAFVEARRTSRSPYTLLAMAGKHNAQACMLEIIPRLDARHHRSLSYVVARYDTPDVLRYLLEHEYTTVSEAVSGAVFNNATRCLEYLLPIWDGQYRAHGCILNAPRMNAELARRVMDCGYIPRVGDFHSVLGRNQIAAFDVLMARHPHVFNFAEFLQGSSCSVRTARQVLAKYPAVLTHTHDGLTPEQVIERRLQVIADENARIVQQPAMVIRLIAPPVLNLLHAEIANARHHNPHV